jgi:iron complex transport system substrate-binding protein
MVKAMALNRRAFCSALIAASPLAVRPAWSTTPLTVTDMAGRRVRLARLPTRIVLLEARDIVSMALLHPDPASLIVGWAAADRLDSPQLLARLMGERKIEIVGRQTPDTISLEGLMGLAPDLVVTNLHMTPHGQDDPLVTRLGAIGIPLIFSDMSSNDRSEGTTRVDTLSDLRNHMRMWGEILGAGSRSESFCAFFETHLENVETRLKDAVPVTTYLEIQSTLDDCCWAAGSGIWGKLLDLAGGRSLPGVTAQWYQKVQLEYLLATPHDVYIASGGGWSSGGRPAIGPGLTVAEGRAGLERMIGRTGFAQLPSVRNRRVYGIWTGLITLLPLNILFIEVAAKWLHPDRCADLDPVATLKEINDRFLAMPIEGVPWVSLQE